MAFVDNGNPILTICIPTYNRGYILKEVLSKYCNDKEFDEDVEIVISDNHSTDDTMQVCQEFCRRYRNIRYYRNENNIRDANFYKVLNYGRGEYLKLINDWSYCVGESLRYMKDIIRSHINEKTPIFFTTDELFTKSKAPIIRCNNLDDYVSVVSTFVTSNNIFGVWKDTWKELHDINKYTNLKLQQEDWSFQIVVKGNGCTIYNKKILGTSRIERRILTGYNWFEIHIRNYYTIMQPYVDMGLISEKTLRRDKINLLEHFKPEFCYTYLFNYTKAWRYETKGTTSLICEYYKKDPYLIWFFLKLPLYYLFVMIPKTIIRHANKMIINRMK